MTKLETYVRSIREDECNFLIKENKLDTNKISDGYHTFEQLYDHRIILYIALCQVLCEDHYVWKSKSHSDGSEWDGWFILGINSEKGKQIIYHLPTSKWNDCPCADILEKAPDWDGHTSEDVLKRISEL